MMRLRRRTTFFQVWSTGRSDQARAVDAIVVMGAAQYDGRPSPVLQARLEHALELYDDGVVPLIVVTGGRQEGDRFTDATTGYNFLRDRGVPDGDIPGGVELIAQGGESLEVAAGEDDLIAAVRQVGGGEPADETGCSEQEDVRHEGRGLPAVRSAAG